MSEPQPPHENDLILLHHLGQYLGLLCVEYIAIDDHGKDIAKPVMQTFSGFFVIVDGQWYFVTAGHVFVQTDDSYGLKEGLDAKKIRLTRSFIADYFGPGAKLYLGNYQPTVMYDFSELLKKTVIVNDDALGLDFAFIPLRDWYVDSAKSNGITAIVESLWQRTGPAMKYIVVGFPDEEKKPTKHDTSTEATVCPCFARMDNCEIPAKYKKPQLPYFAATLPPSEPTSPEGFSGSPIFAVDTDDKSTTYTLVGIEYRQISGERMIVGCHMKDVVAEFRKILKKRKAKRKPTKQKPTKPKPNVKGKMKAKSKKKR